MKKLFNLGTILTRAELRSINGKLAESQNLSKCRHADGTWTTQNFPERWQANAANKACSDAGGTYVRY